MLVRTNKYYLYDQGVINAIVQDFRPVSLRPDAGMIREAFVLNLCSRPHAFQCSSGKALIFLFPPCKSPGLHLVHPVHISDVSMNT